MVSQQLAQNAYANPANQIRSTRSIEYDAVVRITRQLRDASLKGREGFAELAQALHKNRQLWILFASDLVSDGNALPKALQAQLLYLAEFTQVHSAKVLTGEANVRPLLEVNMSVLRGLRGEGTS